MIILTACRVSPSPILEGPILGSYIDELETSTHLLPSTLAFSVLFLLLLHNICHSAGLMLSRTNCVHHLQVTCRLKLLMNDLLVRLRRFNSA